MFQTSLDSNYENNERSKWEFLEYEIWKFTIRYSKIKAKLRREENSFLEIKTKEFRAKLNQWKKIQMKYMKCIKYIYELNEVYKDITNGIKIRRSCNCMSLVKNQTSAS